MTNHIDEAQNAKGDAAGSDSTPATDALVTEWGRVTSDLTVYVKDGENERQVGAFPGSTPEEALAYFSRKYADLEGQITLLESRIQQAVAGSSSITESVKKLSSALEAPTCVGDIAALRVRVVKLQESADNLAKQKQEQRQEAIAKTLAARERIAASAEQIADTPTSAIHWKNHGQKMQDLFQAWQDEQRTAVKPPKNEADTLWKRFSKARSRFEHARREHFTELDRVNKEVRERKEKLIKRAVALEDKGAEGIDAYRALLDEWKEAGRGSRALDEKLWKRFKDAGDVLYAAKAEKSQQHLAELEKNFEAKKELLDSAQNILEITDHRKARAELTRVQLRWDDLGHVPRTKQQQIEKGLIALEKHVAELEDKHWKATNPETKARSEGLRGQLEDSIAALQAEIAALPVEATAAERAALQEKLETQESWLKALG